MEGHLDKAQLKEMDRKSLQELAKKMGVSAAGKNNEIIDRIAAVKVSVSDNDTDVKEKTANADDGADRSGEQEREERAGTGAGEQKKKEGVTVTVVRAFRDRLLDQIKEPGEIYTVSMERAEELTAAGVAEITG